MRAFGVNRKARRAHDAPAAVGHGVHCRCVGVVLLQLRRDALLDDEHLLAHGERALVVLGAGRDANGDMALLGHPPIIASPFCAVGDGKVRL